MSNLYLDTLYSAFEMIASGITTVQHIHGWMPGTLAEVEADADEVIRAYEDVGMRVSYSYAVRDQNRLVYQADEEFVASLPHGAARADAALVRALPALSLDDYMALFEDLHGRHHNKRRVKIQLAPANLHWCSDEALGRLADTSRKYDVPHAHAPARDGLPEGIRRRRGECTAVEYIDRFGMLGPQMTLGHGVWLNEEDIDRMAATGTCVCHNCSSNFRLRSGVAALNVFEAKGINTAIGLDEAGINDDRDMLQEMSWCCARIACRAWSRTMCRRTAQVLRMATVGRREDDGIRRAASARWRSGGRRHGADRLGADQLSLSRRGDAAARCRDPARQELRA